MTGAFAKHTGGTCPGPEGQEPGGLRIQGLTGRRPLYADAAVHVHSEGRRVVAKPRRRPAPRIRIKV